MSGPGPGTLDVRPLAETDLDAVHRLELASSPDPWSRDLLAAELPSADGHGAPNDRIWLVAVEVVDRGAAVVGFGGVLQVIDEAHVMNLAVDPARRRLGVASRLLAALLLAIGDRGAVSVTLEVRASNVGAIELYRRFGFEVAGRRPRYYPDGEDAEIMWCHRIDRPDTRRRFRDLGGLAGTSEPGGRR